MTLYIVGGWSGSLVECKFISLPQMIKKRHGLESFTLINFILVNFQGFIYFFKEKIVNFSIISEQLSYVWKENIYRKFSMIEFRIVKKNIIQCYVNTTIYINIQ